MNLGYLPIYINKEPATTTVTEKPRVVIPDIPIITSKKKEPTRETPKTPVQAKKKSSKRKDVFTDPKQFRTKLMAAYEKELKNRGLDTKYALWLTAQDVHESASGAKPSGHWNYGGIKATESTQSSTPVKTWEEEQGKRKDITANFANYKDINDYVRHKLNLLQYPRYRVAFNTNTPEEFYSAIHKGGYATDSKYVQKVLKRLNDITVRSAQQGGTLTPEEFVNAYVKARTNGVFANYILDNNIKNTVITHDTSKIPEGSWGATLGHTVFVHPNDPITTAHEITHSYTKGDPTDSVKRIKQALTLYGKDALLQPNEGNSYYDDPREILARLVQTYYAQNFDPTKRPDLPTWLKWVSDNVVGGYFETEDGTRVLVDKDMKPLMENYPKYLSPETTKFTPLYKDSEFLGRYSIPFLLHIGRIAQNKQPSPIKDITYAKHGAKMPAFHHMYNQIKHLLKK